MNIINEVSEDAEGGETGGRATNEEGREPSHVMAYRDKPSAGAAGTNWEEANLVHAWVWCDLHSKEGRPRAEEAPEDGSSKADHVCTRVTELDRTGRVCRLWPHT